MIVKSSETHEGDVIITGINAVTGKEIFSVVFSSHSKESRRQSMSSIGITTNEILDSHTNEETETVIKTFEYMDPETLIVVSTFLARSPTSYGKLNDPLLLARN